MQLSKFFALLLSCSMLSSPANSEARSSNLSGSSLSGNAHQFSGLSLGGNLGFIHISPNVSWTNHIPGPSNGLHGHYAATAKGGSIGMHASYGYVSSCNMFYWGGELTADYNFPRGTIRDNINYDFNFRYSLRDSYTAAMRAGFIAHNTLIYIKAGAALACRKVSARYLNSQPLNTRKSSTQYKIGAVIGFGVDIALVEKISCGLESTYTQYQSDKFSYPTGASYRMKTESYNLKLKITYKI